jgi:hypothetical protein
MVHGAWRDSMTALFQDFVAHETHRLTPSFNNEEAGSLMIAPEIFSGQLENDRPSRLCCVFGEKNP